MRQGSGRSGGGPPRGPQARLCTKTCVCTKGERQADTQRYPRETRPVPITHEPCIGGRCGWMGVCPMPAEPERWADPFNNPSVEATMSALTPWEGERLANAKPSGAGKRHRTQRLLPVAPLAFEQVIDLYAPPAHVPEPLDEPEPEPSFRWTGAPTPTATPRRSRISKCHS